MKIRLNPHLPTLNFIKSHCLPLSVLFIPAKKIYFIPFLFGFLWNSAFSSEIEVKWTWMDSGQNEFGFSTLIKNVCHGDTVWGHPINCATKKGGRGTHYSFSYEQFNQGWKLYGFVLWRWKEISKNLENELNVWMYPNGTFKRRFSKLEFSLGITSRFLISTAHDFACVQLIKLISSPILVKDQSIMRQTF